MKSLVQYALSAAAALAMIVTPAQAVPVSNLAATAVSGAAVAAASADPADAAPSEGRFVNPITDVCWSCLFPLTLGSIPLFKGDKPDTDNPSSPVCACPAPAPLFLRVGLSVGFWEPARLADVTQRPFCFVNLGGLKIDPGFGYPGKSSRKSDGVADRSAYHVHWYTYPVMIWLELLTDFLCVERTSFDIAYITELDPLWQDDHLSVLIHPEALIFSNHIATAACSVDCAASTAGRPRNEMFWCAGCQGTMYPMNGNISGEYSDVQGALLAAERFAFKMHRQLLADGTSGPKAVCSKYKMPIMDKRQYRFQLTNPVRHTKGKFTCPVIGASTVPYESGKTIPIRGEDYGFLVWRKRNCCVTVIP